MTKTKISEVLERVGVVPRGDRQVQYTWNGKPVSNVRLQEVTASTPGAFAAARAMKTQARSVIAGGVTKKSYQKSVVKRLDAAEGLLGAAEKDEDSEVISGFLRAFPGLPDAFKIEFEKQIKQISSRQAWSGSWLEYTGMRFTQPGVAVIDQERTQINDWRDPAFQAIVNPAANLTIFLKSKFNLRALNNDPSIIKGSKPPARWTDIVGKGKDDVEPDVIVSRRKPNGTVLISIVELKIGNGKKEQKAAEHHQLMRLHHRIEMMCKEAGEREPTIELYFCAWQHGTRETTVESIDFRKSTLGAFERGWSDYYVTVINSTDFEKITLVKANFVNALLKKMDIVRLKLFYKTLKQFMSRRKGRYYPQMVAYANSLNEQLNGFTNQVLNRPPVSVMGGASRSNQPEQRATASAALGLKFGARQPKSFNNLSPNSLAAEIARAENRLGRLQASSARRMTQNQIVQTARAQNPELRRYEAAARSALSPVSENNTTMGINFNKQ